MESWERGESCGGDCLFLLAAKKQAPQAQAPAPEQFTSKWSRLAPMALVPLSDIQYGEVLPYQSLGLCIYGSDCSERLGSRTPRSLRAGVASDMQRSDRILPWLGMRRIASEATLLLVAADYLIPLIPPYFTFLHSACPRKWCHSEGSVIQS